MLFDGEWVVVVGWVEYVDVQCVDFGCVWNV